MESDMPPRWTARRTLVVIATAAVASILLLLSVPKVRTAVRIAPGFAPCGGDPRVYCETGSQDLARRFAAALPGAVSAVEGTLEIPFEAEFRLYVCATHESFARRIGHPVDTPVRGAAFLRDVWVSPRAFDFMGRDTVRETLAHELTHLALGRHLGWWKRTRLVPAWFQEGLADWVADTGLERISRRQAIARILAGDRFVPDTEGHLPLPKGARDYGVTWTTYHAQSRLLIEFLHDGREDRFRTLVHSVLRGDRFDEAFRMSYGCSVESVWEEFLRSLRSGHEAGPG